METRAHYGIIGAFVLAVVAGAFLFVHWFTATETGPGRESVLVVFEDSISGLVKGSGVLFNGIRVGTVSRVYYDVNRPERAFAEMAIDPNTPIRVDTKARLNTTILSGSGVIVLVGGKPGAPELVAKPGEALPTIYAQRSGIASILEQTQGLSAKAKALRDNIDGIAAENRETVTATLNNLGAMAEALGRNGPSMNRAMASIGDAGAKMGPAGEKLADAADSAGAIKRAIDPTQVSAAIANAAGVKQTFTDNRPRLDAIQRDVAALSPALGAMAPRLEQVARDGSRLSTAVDTAKVGATADNVDRIQSAYARVQPDLDATQRNVNEIGDKFSRLSDRADAVRRQYAAFIASEAGRSAFTAVGGAIAAIRNTSNRLDGHIQAISNAVKGLSGTAGREFKAVGAAASLAGGDIARTGRNLKRRFGGEAQRLPTYSGP
jgi:phospholipid/cholesterol/gamma-HCH transport system substrate-binding protein